MKFKGFLQKLGHPRIQGADKLAALLKKRDCTAELPLVRAAMPEKLPRLFRLMPGMRAKPQAGG